MKKIILIIFSLIQLSVAAAHSDTIQFGNAPSEKQHHFLIDYSNVEKGGLDESSRRLLAPETAGYIGGKMSFRMKVDAEKQNYLTVRFWGSDADNSMILLFCEGKQVGYRHLGDIDFVWLGNGLAPLPGRFFYVTIPIPLSQSNGKTEINLELRSYGDIWGYGETFDKYQRNMDKPSRGIYNAYTHTETCFVPAKTEKQGSAIMNPPIEKANGQAVIGQVKDLVNKELTNYIKKNKPLSQLEIWFLADAYDVKWTVAYHNPEVVTKVAASIDAYYIEFLKNPKLAYNGPGVYNEEWLAVGPIARGIRGLWPELKPTMDVTFDNGNGQQVSRRKAWAELMNAGLQFGITHRRQYTNQSMIIDLFAYHTNRALALIDPDKALPESKMLHYLHESVGLTPWLGIETANGPDRPLGDNYWQLTAKGLTKELGFVGYYGEVLDWVNELYKATCNVGDPNSGDKQIKQQLLKMMMARSYFRYPALDNSGNRAMRAEAVVGWRDAGHYPGDILYGDRGTAWDATPLMTAANTLDPIAIGFAQQLLEDNQFFKAIEEKLRFGNGIRNARSLLFVPDEYELLKNSAPVATRLPMTKSSPDFVFADEEDGVVAIKNDDEILYASLYWRARVAVNKLAKVHYITPTMDRISNIYIESIFEPSGMEVTRQNMTNLGFSSARDWYKDIESAHTGDLMPVARIPEGVKYNKGDENVYAGRAQFYLMRYGKYLVAMNSSKDKIFDVTLPVDMKNSVDLTNNKKPVTEGVYKLAPMTTVVYYTHE